MSKKTLLILLIINLQLHAFEDSDIDGVSDDIDLCPDTSFDDLVDKNGCPKNGDYWGKITLSVGSDVHLDDETSSDYNFFSNYKYKVWDLSMYSDQEGSYDLNNNQSQATGDLYFSIGYTMEQDRWQNHLSIGAKLATGDEDISTGENDYFINSNLAYLLTPQTTLLLGIDYTLTGDNTSNHYENPLGYTVGMGYLINDQWYNAITYQQSQSIYTDSRSYQSITWQNSYQFTDTFFGSIGYIRGIDELSYDHTFTVRLGVSFE